MIPEGYLCEENYHKLTRSQAKAYIVFEMKELERHKRDIIQIVIDVETVRRIHNL